MYRASLRWSVALLVCVLAAACSSGQPQTAEVDSMAPTESPRPARSESAGPARSEPARPAEQRSEVAVLPSKPALRQVAIKLDRVAKLSEPTAMATREGDDGIYVTDRQGLIQVVRRGKATTLLDWKKRTIGGNEQGMLGLAFSPDGTRLYVYYIWQGDQKGVDQDSVLDEYTMDGNRLDVDSRRELLRIKQPSTVHKGGQLTFGDDGMLYLALGDGGPADLPPDTSQRTNTLLGKIIRIDPAPAGDRPYTIPQDNPYAGQQGARGEIFALGLRNPWRFSFDRETGDMWIGDVGRYEMEEINVRSEAKAAGSNFGWPHVEGTAQLRAGTPKDAVRPFTTYGHEGRCAVIGGYVYRGRAIPRLRGAYLYGDHCDGQLRALVRRNGRVIQEATLGDPVPGMTSFGQDEQGELYILSLTEGLQKIVLAD